jgi:hypothetical protein
MTQEAIDLLHKKVSEAAHKVADLGVNENDIALVTKAIVFGAERQGNPITVEEISAFGPELQTVILGGIIKRLEARPDRKYRVIDDTTLEVLGAANSKTEVGDMAREHREMGH